MSSNILVLDANIIIRAALGKKVRELLIEFSGVVDFFTPDVCFEDAKKYLPIIFEKRGLPLEPILAILLNLQCFLQIVEKSIYQDRCIDAQQRVKDRDINDWPVVATALALNSPIWTEDQDFFGTGLPTWTTDRIHLFFESLS